MKNMKLLVLSVLAMAVFSMPVMAAETSKDKHVQKSAQGVEENNIMRASDIICPACGAIGYPTGVVIPLSEDTEIEAVPSALAMYQQYQCSANPEHYWYVYLYDAIQ